MPARLFETAKPEGSSARLDRFDTLNVALVGAGMISGFHLKAWMRLKAVRIVAVVDPDLARAQGRAAEYGIPAAYGSVDEMFARETPDAIDVASPRETHASIVRRAADLKIDVLCQKPLAPTFDEAQDLVSDVDNRIRLMVHENWRFRPYYRKIAQWLSDGVFGTLQTGRVSVFSSGLLPDRNGVLPSLERQPFFRDQQRLLVMETLIHQIDVVRWLFGPLDLDSANLQRATDAVIGESAAAILFRTQQNGAPIFVEGNLTCSGFPAASRDEVVLIGDRSSITLANDELKLLGSEPETFKYEHARAYQECFDATIAHFAHCLRSGDAFETNAQENLATLGLVEAIYQKSGWGYAGHDRFAQR